MTALDIDYDEPTATELLTMAQIHQIAEDHLARAAELALSHVAPPMAYVKEWRGDLLDALALMKACVPQYGWAAVVEIDSCTGYYVVDTAALSRIDPDLVQILAETDC